MWRARVRAHHTVSSEGQGQLHLFGGVLLRKVIFTEGNGIVLASTWVYGVDRAWCLVQVVELST